MSLRILSDRPLSKASDAAGDRLHVPLLKATKWRKVVAMGASPWNAKTYGEVPKGRKELSASQDLSALRGFPIIRTTQSIWLAPMATTFRPLGTDCNALAVLRYAGRGRR